MSNCSIGDKPRVDYKFNNEPGITYQSQFSPIDITTGSTPFSSASNYDPRGYQITFPSPQGAYGRVTGIVVDYKIFTYQGENYLASISCGGGSFPSVLNQYTGLRITGDVVIDRSVTCPVSTGESICTLTISYQGTTLFQVQGKCPVTYVVTCGNCPPGTCECHSDSYPGYCCNDCDSNAAQIAAITNELRAKNGR